MISLNKQMNDFVFSIKYQSIQIPRIKQQRNADSIEALLGVENKPVDRIKCFRDTEQRFRLQVPQVRFKFGDGADGHAFVSRL